MTSYSWIGVVYYLMLVYDIDIGIDIDIVPGGGEEVEGCCGGAGCGQEVAGAQTELSCVESGHSGQAHHGGQG